MNKARTHFWLQKLSAQSQVSTLGDLGELVQNTAHGSKRKITKNKVRR